MEAKEVRSRIYGAANIQWPPISLVICGPGANFAMPTKAPIRKIVDSDPLFTSEWTIR